MATKDSEPVIRKLATSYGCLSPLCVHLLVADHLLAKFFL